MIVIGSIRLLHEALAQLNIYDKKKFAQLLRHAVNIVWHDCLLHTMLQTTSKCR